MSNKFTLRDAQTGLAALSETTNAILALLQGQNTAPQNATAPAPAANLVAPIPGAAVGPHTRVEEQVALANRNGGLQTTRITANAAVEDFHDNGERELPKDNPDREGPCWSTGVLNNTHGLFPRMRRKKNGKTGALEIVRYPVAPPDRSHFMANASSRPFGLSVTLAVPDGKGGEKTVNFPAVCNLSAKEFSSGDHGLYGEITSIDIVLPDGSEFTLAGQVNMQLKKRKN